MSNGSRGSLTEQRAQQGATAWGFLVAIDGLRGGLRGFLRGLNSALPLAGYLTLALIASVLRPVASFRFT